MFDRDAPWCFAGPDSGDAGQVQRARRAGGERAAPAEPGGGRQHRGRQDNDVHTTATARRDRGGGSRREHSATVRGQGHHPNHTQVLSIERPSLFYSPIVEHFTDRR